MTVLCACGCSRPIIWSEPRRDRTHPRFVKGHHFVGNRYMIGFHHSQESKDKIARSKFGKHLSEEHKKKLSIANTGKIIPAHVREKISQSQIGNTHRKGSKTPMDVRIKISCTSRGINPYDFSSFSRTENEKIRSSQRYTAWRISVFKRDGWKCLRCGAHNGNGRAVVLNADHIMPLAKFPQFAYERWNGRTLCLGCHKKTVSYAKRPHLELPPGAA